MKNPRTILLLLVLALMASTTSHSRAQSNTVLTFNDWPVDNHSSWETNTVDGWTLHDGLIRSAFLGLGPPIDGLCAWLPDTQTSTNAWLQSPLLPGGVGTFSFWVRRNNGTSNENFFAVQHSPDGTNWVTDQSYDRMQDDWQELSVGINVPTPLYMRIAKNGDAGPGQYLGLENVSVGPPPGIIPSGLAIDPLVPSLSTPVTVRLTIAKSPTASNVVVMAFYRNGVSGPYTAIGMTNTVSDIYETIAPIPAGVAGVVQYYVQASYDGEGPNPVFAPEGGSNGPAFYDTTSPYLSKGSRQLQPSSHRTPLIISEIMYNPKGDDASNSLEFIEIFNTEPVANRLDGFRITGDIKFTFPAGATIGPREFRVIARNPTALVAEYGIGNVVGPYTGSLPNGAGTVRLRNRTDALLLDIDYDSTGAWPVTPDGAGHSLTLACPDYGEALAEAWAPSRMIGGTPSFDDPVTNTPLDAIVINEFLAHTDLPQTDFVELYNYGDVPVDLSGCFLSETVQTNKFRIPTNTVLGAGQHIAFDQPALGFSLSSHGDEIYLLTPDASRVVDAVRFPAQRNGVATGRFPDGSESFYVLASPTTNAPNAAAGPRYEQIVINEIMYHPISSNDDEEYIELYNRSSNAVDVGYWRFTEGLRFTIPPGTVIPGGEFLVIARNAAHLIPRYGQLNAGNTIGNYKGRLSDGGERIVLARPDDLATPFTDYVTVDDVTYGDGGDWGEWADGGGSSLELVDAASDNRRGMNWAGSDETDKAAWTEVDYLGTIDHGGNPPNELRLMYLGRGECLVDDIVVESSDSNTTYLADNLDAGIGPWILYGNHSRSSLSVDGGTGDSQALHVRASGAGNHGVWTGWNQAFFNYLGRPMSLQPASGSEVRIGGKVRWQKGWPYITMVLRGFWMEASVAMVLPTNLGSPGQHNSQLVNNIGPAIDDVMHFPVLPAAGEDAVVSARVYDPDGTASVTLKYRVDPSATVHSIPMLDNGASGDRVAGDGLYSALLPGQSQNVIAAFTVAAQDAAGAPATSVFPGDAPPGAPAHECLIGFGQSLKPGIFANYIMWMTASDVARWTSLPGGKYSNEPQHLTFVYGPYRAIYNAGARWRGLWRGYTSPVVSGAYSVELPKAHRFMGQNEFKIDQPGQNGGDATRMNELLSYWIAREIDVPGAQLRFAHLHVNHNFRGTFHDLQVPSSDFNASWFNDDDPRVFKDVGWSPADPYKVYKDGFGKFQKSRYRWYWRKRKGASPNDDFSTVYNLATAVDNFPMTETGRKRVESVVDIRGWASFFTLNGAIGGWDHYGFSWAHNMFSYVPYHKPGWLFIYDLDHVFAGTPTIFPNTSWPVPNRMFNQYDPFKRANYAVAKELVNGPMQSAALDAFVDGWYDALIANNGSQSNGSAVSSPAAKKSWLNGARGTLQGLVNSVDSAFAINANDFSSADHIVTLSGIAPVEVTRISINGINNDVRFTGLINWQLDVGLPEGVNALTVTGYDWRGTAVASDTITVTITQPPPSPVDQLVITEIMYHPTTPASEYVEVYNKSTHTYDLRGWRLNGTDIVLEGGAIIGPGQYRIVAENRTAYQYSYGNVEVALGDFDGDLDNGGETVSLQMPQGSNAWLTVDSVTYDDTAPWPSAADGQGQALQIIDINVDNNRVGNWGPRDVINTNFWKFKSVTGLVTVSPFLQIQTKLQIFAHSAGDVFIDSLCLVTGTVATSGANLLTHSDFESPWGAPWSATGNHGDATVVPSPVYEGNGSLRLRATGPGALSTDAVIQSRALSGLGGQPVTLSYWYYEDPANPNTITVKMVHTDADITHSVAPPPPATEDYRSPGTTSHVAQVLFEFPLLWINEVMPSNTSVIADNAGDFDPWIELFNADSVPILLDGYRLSDDYANPGKWAFPTGVTVAAGARLLIWADGETGETQAGHLHANFALNSISGSVALVRQHMGDPVIVDYLDYAHVGEDASYGSYPEGQAVRRQLFPVSTPGAANSLTSAPLSVVFNEWMADNQGTIQDPIDGRFEDWFELYNPANQAASLGGYYLTDTLSSTNQFTIPGGTVIGAKGHLLAWADNDSADNAPGVDLHVNFGLSRNGDSLGLYAPDGTLVDSVNFGAQEVDVSQGRWPDGAAMIYPFTIATPGDTNSLFTILSIAGLAPVGFSFDAVAEPGHVYTIRGADDLRSTNWFLVDVVTAETSVLNYTDTNAPFVPLRFYRVYETP